MIIPVPNEYVSVAQLDRASDYGSEGRVFESCHSQKETVYHFDIRFLLFPFRAKNIRWIYLRAKKGAVSLPPLSFYRG